MIGPKSQHIDYSRLCGLFEEALRAYRVKKGEEKRRGANLQQSKAVKECR